MLFKKRKNNNTTHLRLRMTKPWSDTWIPVKVSIAITIKSVPIYWNETL